MKNYEGRHIDLKNRINTHLSKLTKIDSDYFSNLKQNDLIELKTVLADINNLLTFRTTIAAANYIADYFDLTKEEKENLLNEVDQTSPNSKGFDIHINGRYKIIAEIKCTSFVNNGEKFGAAQRASILEDFQKLKKGKTQVPDTTHYFKFLFLIDLGSRSTKAIEHLRKETNLRVETEARLNRNNIRKHIFQLTDDLQKEHLDIANIYYKILAVNHQLVEKYVF